MAQCTGCPSVPLGPSGQHLARWPLREDPLDFQWHLLLFCIRAREEVIYQRCFPWTGKAHLTFTPLHFCISLQARASRPAKAWRWNRILTEYKLSFLSPSFLPLSSPRVPDLTSLHFRSVSDAECDGRHGRTDRRNEESGARCSG